MSGWLQPPARRCLFSVRRPQVARQGVWCNLYPGKGTEGERKTLHKTNLLELQFTSVPGGNKGMCSMRERWHLVQGHAEGTDEAPIVVLQSNGGG